MFGVKRYLFSGFALLPLSIIASSALCGELSTSTEVQGNITTLQQTKNCPQCDLSGANLIRMDLSGANLEGANLSRAKLNLTNLTEANLRGADLREVGFGGADLADADLRGANLRGTSFAGAYMSGVLLDGELITTKPYSEEQVSDVEETIYVEDTVKPKIATKTEEMSIRPRRDFEEIPPVLPAEDIKIVEKNEVDENSPEDSPTKDLTASSEVLVPQQSVAAPEAKVAPSIQQVRMPSPDVEKSSIATNDSRDDLEAVTIKKENRDERSSAVSPTNQTSKIEKGEGRVDATATIVNDQHIETNITDDAATEVVAVLEPVSKKEMSIAAIDDESQTNTKDPGEAIADSLPEQENISDENGVDSPVAAVEQAVVQEKQLSDDLESIPVKLTEKDTMEEVIQENMDTTIVENLPSSDSEVLTNVEHLLETNQCYGCNLEGADLSGEDLEEADLEGANLRRANLKEADLDGANLKGANLSEADLRKADLDRADLYKADLSGADLTEASLEETLIDDAVLTGVKGYQQKTLLMVE